MRAVQALSPDDLGVLLTWFAVLRVCVAMLGVEALGLGFLSVVRPPRGLLRVGALAPLAAAVGAGLLARGAWSAYFDLLPLTLPPPRTYPPAFGEWYEHRISLVSQAVGFYDTAGWIVLVATGLLLIAGGVLAVKAIRGRGPAHRERAGSFSLRGLFMRKERIVG